MTTTALARAGGTFSCPAWVVEASAHLTPLEFRVLITICRWADWTTWTAWRRNAAKVAEALGLRGLNHVREALRSLIRRGVLVEGEDPDTGREVWRIVEPEPGALSTGIGTHKKERETSGIGIVDVPNRDHPRPESGRFGSRIGVDSISVPYQPTINPEINPGALVAQSTQPDTQAQASLPAVEVTGEVVPAAGPAKRKRSKKAEQDPGDAPDLLALFVKWQTRTGMTGARFATWKRLLAKKVARYGLEDVDAAIEYATTDTAFWTVSVDGKPPRCRDLDSILRDQQFPKLPELWRARAAPPLAPLAGAAVPADLPTENDLREAIQRHASDFQHRRGGLLDHNGIPPTPEEAARLGFPPGLLPAGSATVDGVPVWVWPAHRMLTACWLTWVAAVYGGRKVKQEHLNHPDVERLHQEHRGQRKQFDDEMAAALKRARKAVSHAA